MGEKFNFDEKYCERRGIIQTDDGKKYKQCTLERYAAKGYLDGEKYDGQQLLGAGLRLARDYYLAGLDNVSANDVSKVRVDGGGKGNEPAENFPEQLRLYFFKTDRSGDPAQNSPGNITRRIRKRKMAFEKIYPR
jgi:hypothetical protein